MYLTNEQERILKGEFGIIMERNFRLLVKLGDIYNADKMIPINSVQVAGVSYKSIGDPGLEFLEDYANNSAKVKVLTTLNPCGMDMESWQELKFPKEFAEKQIRIIKSFEKMGIILSATCTPYLVGNLPRYKEHIAWSESSAVSFANSVIGARTNREGGPSALASAFCGLTPNYGLHLTENRKADFLIKVNCELNFTSDFGALGYYIGKVVKDKKPYFILPKQADTDELKSLGAAMASSGAVALYFVEGQTPEAENQEIKNLEKIEFGEKELKETYGKLNTGKNADIVIIGCPHASLKEIQKVAEIVKGKKLKKELWVCTSRMMKDISIRLGLAKTIENAGGKIVADTCMVVSPIEEMGYKTTAVNSGKAGNYLPSFCKQNVVFGSLEEIIE